MRSMVLAALAAGSLSMAGAAQAAEGSGTITFEFTGFHGPFGTSSLSNLGDVNNYLLVGSVNGQIPTPNGKHSPTGDPDFVYAGGDAPLSGQSVDFVYTNAPGALDNIVSFTPVAAFPNVVTGQAFKLGTLSFTNGQWVGGSGNPATNFPVVLDFTLATHSLTSAFNQTLHDSLTVVTNQAVSDADCATNPQTRQDEADFVYITSAPQLGSGRVYDNFCKPPNTTNTGTVELWGKFGSLDYVDFRNPTGGLFIADSTGVGSLGAPEPAQWTLMLTGFAGLGLALRRARSGRAVPVHA